MRYLFDNKKAEFDLTLALLRSSGKTAVNEMNLERWPIFSLLDDEFTGTIKMVGGKQAFTFTKVAARK